MTFNNSNLKPFFCIFCKDQNYFRVRLKVEFEEHLIHAHKVLFEVNILHATNFLDTDKKKTIVEKGKQSAKKEGVFMCTFCSDEKTFDVGQSQTFKDHLCLVHSIFHEVELLLAVHFVNDNFDEIPFLNVYPVSSEVKENYEDLNLYKSSKETLFIGQYKSETILGEEIKPKINTIGPSIGHGLRCNICTYSTKKMNVASNKVIRLHLKNVHFVCKICEYKFDNRNTLNGHYKSSHFVDDVRLKCSIDGCLKTSREADIYLHIQTAHQNMGLNSDRLKIKIRNEIKSVCNICGGTFGKQYIKQHIKDIHGNKPVLNCSQCQFSTKFAYSLKDHERGHIGMVRCDMCEESFTKQRHVRKHKILFHEGVQLLCATCDYKTWSPNNLRRHKESHNEKSIICDKCEYTGKGNYQMRAHMRIHGDPRYKCGKCDYKCYNSGNLYNHRIMKHGHTILKCDECNFSSKSKRTVKIHTERVHK